MCGNEDETTNDVFDTYQEVLVKAYNLIDKAQIQRLTTMIRTSVRIYVYGFGSSGLVATSLKIGL